MTEWISGQWRLQQKKLANDVNGRTVFLLDGKTPEVGQVFRNPAYAAALRLVAAQGPAAFYQGAIAQAILATSRRLGGVMTAADLADFRPEWVTPISTAYKGWQVYELPPNTQGFGTLEMLNIFDRYPLAEWGFADPRTFYIKTEAQKFNDYSDRVGGGQAVMYDAATGVKYGASDPRKDGEAVPQPAAILGAGPSPASPGAPLVLAPARGPGRPVPAASGEGH